MELANEVESVLDSDIISAVLSIIFTILYLFSEHVWCLNFAVILRSYCPVASGKKNETMSICASNLPT